MPLMLQTPVAVSGVVAVAAPSATRHPSIRNAPNATLRPCFFIVNILVILPLFMIRQFVFRPGIHIPSLFIIAHLLIFVNIYNTHPIKQGFIDILSGFMVNFGRCASC